MDYERKRGKGRGKVSYSAWDECEANRQETVCEWFPTRRGKMGIHSGRKLFAYSFLSGMGRLHIIATGNYSRKVSYTAWGEWYSWRQDTLRWEISRLRFAALEMTGTPRCQSAVSDSNQPTKLSQVPKTPTQKSVTPEMTDFFT